MRRYESPPLASGRNYTCTVKAKWLKDDGKTVEIIREVKVRPGQESIVNFRETPSETIRTSVNKSSPTSVSIPCDMAALHPGPHEFGYFWIPAGTEDANPECQYQVGDSIPIIPRVRHPTPVENIDGDTLAGP